MQQHSTQPYQGQAPSRQVQQSPILSSNPSTGQQPFPVQTAYNHHPSIQSPYLSNQSQFSQQQSQPSSESVYYNSHPSPRSSNGATYYSADTKPEHMAAATLGQRPFPPIYHTPQSNSPASVTSPQTHDHGRPMYAQQSSQMSQPMYSYQYSPLAQLQTSYGPQHQPSMTSTQILPNNYHPSQMSQPVSAHTPLTTSPRIKSDPQAFSQTPRQGTSMMHQQHLTPGPTPGSTSSAPSQPQGPPTGSSAAPGPIPATTPLVVRQDNNGVQWIAFEYSRDRVKMEYTIRCDVESVDTNALAQDFKSENCVYPRACVPRDQYKGNRLNYESDCNQVGWALAELNPCLRGKRGLIQRAVDSWRNSNQDPRLRSRRVRRQAKMTNKSRANTSGSGQSAVSAPTGVPGSNSMPAPNRSNTIPSSGAQLHHHGQSEMSPTSQDPLQASGYSNNQGTHRTPSIAQQLSSPNELRHPQSFPLYQSYPNVSSSMNPSMAPPISGSIHPYARPGGNTIMASGQKRARDEEDSELFGDLPEGKKRKFILVDDEQKSTRVRVKVTLDQVNVQDIPDSYRRQNSVYPRSYYPIQMQSEPSTGRFSISHNDADEAAPTIGNMTVPVTTSDGETQIEVSQLTCGKKDRERKINELGYRMAWGQGRVFSNRPIFLARALDAYRTKQRTALAGTSSESTAIPPHLEVRPGKRRWLERTRPGTVRPHSGSPQPKIQEEQ